MCSDDPYLRSRNNSLPGRTSDSTPERTVQSLRPLKGWPLGGQPPRRGRAGGSVSLYTRLLRSEVGVKSAKDYYLLSPICQPETRWTITFGNSTLVKGFQTVTARDGVQLALPTFTARDGVHDPSRGQGGLNSRFAGLPTFAARGGVKDPSLQFRAETNTHNSEGRAVVNKDLYTPPPPLEDLEIMTFLRISSEIRDF